MILQEVTLKDLVCFDSLRRHHSRRQVDACVHSLKTFGQYSPLIVSGNEVLCGQLVLASLKKLKFKTAFVYDVGELDESKKRELRFLDNHIFDAGSFDLLKLKDVLVGFDFDEVANTGFSVEEVNDFINDAEVLPSATASKAETEYECSCGWFGFRSDAITKTD